jgi:hypothetical protein
MQTYETALSGNLTNKSSLTSSKKARCEDSTAERRRAIQGISEAFNCCVARFWSELF